MVPKHNNSTGVTKIDVLLEVVRLASIAGTDHWPHTGHRWHNGGPRLMPKLVTWSSLNCHSAFVNWATTAAGTLLLISKSPTVITALVTAFVMAL